VAKVPEAAMLRVAPTRVTPRVKSRALPQGFEELRARLATAQVSEVPKRGAPKSPVPSASASKGVPLVPVTSTLTQSLPRDPSGSVHRAQPEVVAEPSAPASVPVTSTLTQSLPRDPSGSVHRAQPEVVAEPSEPASVLVTAHPCADSSLRATLAAVPPAPPADDQALAGARLRTMTQPDREVQATVRTHGSEVPLPEVVTSEQIDAREPVPVADSSVGALDAATPTVQVHTPEGSTPVVASLVVSLPHLGVPTHQGSAMEVMVGTPLPTGTPDEPTSVPLSSLPVALLQIVRQGALPRTVTLRLEPKELGEVQLQVQAVGSDIHVQIQARSHETLMLVGSMLEDLAQQLGRDLGSQGDRRQQQPTQRPGVVVGAPPPRLEVDASAAPAGSGLVDLHL